MTTEEAELELRSSAKHDVEKHGDGSEKWKMLMSSVIGRCLFSMNTGHDHRVTHPLILFIHLDIHLVRFDQSTARVGDLICIFQNFMAEVDKYKRYRGGVITL